MNTFVDAMKQAQKAYFNLRPFAEKTIWNEWLFQAAFRAGWRAKEESHNDTNN